MPSGANSLQNRTKYAAFNRGTMRPNTRRSRGRGKGRHGNERTPTLTEQGIDVDGFLAHNKTEIERLRRGKGRK